MRPALLLLPALALAGCGVAEEDAPREAGPATAAARKHVVTYAEAQRRGQPIAILRRPTALRSGGRRVATPKLKTEFGAPRVLTVLGKRHGRLRVMASELPNGRTGWIRADAARFSFTPWTVTADLSERAVSVRRRGHGVVRRFSVAIGRPSTPTPIGRFAVTDKLRMVGGSSAYGWGVLAVSGHQPHIEPGWRGGDRLAIHGTGSLATIGYAASFGCLRASRADVRWLVRHVWLGSVVTIRP